MRICFATNNAHKLEEVKLILGKEFELVSLKDIGCTEELAEDQNTLEGNSFQKAEYVYTNYNIPCFADDSGLEVEALKGAPGVISAHYAGTRDADDNMNLLLKNMQGIENRKAQFRAIITLITPQVTKQFEGIVRGEILKEKRGTQGFGYNPVFLPEGYTRSMAEMTMEEKNQISHRALAVQKLADFLKSYK
jgi:XTP/dITP diphosphohydrolase